MNGVQARMKDDDLYTFLEQTVADHMTRDAKTVSRDVSLRELEGLFERDDFNAYPVEESRKSLVWFQSSISSLVSRFRRPTWFRAMTI